MLESLFEEVAHLKARNFIKKRPQNRFFPVNIAKFLRLLISKASANDCFLTISMVQCYMGMKVQGLNCMMASDLRVPGLVFCF